jgi:hypothetical protein
VLPQALGPKGKRRQDLDAHVTIHIFFADREPAEPYPAGQQMLTPPTTTIRTQRHRSRAIYFGAAA